MELIPISQWFKGISEGPLLVSGPCSAESHEQVMETARGIAALGRIHIFRAGVWKPRTRPGNFEGVGEPALHWLCEARDELGFRLAVEVATPEHLEIALKYNIDLLWVGARTSSNPFSVDQLAAAMKGIDTPVLIKNPVYPDIDLWIGTIERFHRVGIAKLGAIHRGFSPFQRSTYRNLPKWEIPIELKSRFPSLPIICDPSHIAGRPSLLKEVAQKALDLAMDGLMIESHINPAIALSDARQQITPSELDALLNTLVFRNSSLASPDFLNRIEALREIIDSIDSQLLELLAQRMDVAKEIGEFKKQNNVAIIQLRRWEEMLNCRVEQGNALGLDPEYVKSLLRLVHRESIRQQAKIMDNNSSVEE
jgi:chorismate mutase